MSRPRGVTLTEMLVVVFGLGCLAALMVPVVRAARDAWGVTGCAEHLRRIGAGVLLYAMDHDGYLPDTGACSPAAGPVPPDAFHYPSRLDLPGRCDWPDVRAVGNQANLWLLVRGGYADPALFVCPATADRPSLNDPRSLRVMGFLAYDPETARLAPEESRFLSRVAAGRCSYSYQNQFDHPGGGASGSPLGTTHRSLHPQDLAILADRNPYTRVRGSRQSVVDPDTEPEANSPNHMGTGQNVLYLSGTVEWHETPRCGALGPDGARDHIYRPDAGDPLDPLAVPGSASDSHLAP